ncbi:MAG: ATP-binding protein [Planctomycetes bacterium]|nr:ATP-binding protein [Planctomycetota bacterium]
MSIWRSIRFRLAAISSAAVVVVGLAIGLVSYHRLAMELQSADTEFARHEALELAQVVAQVTSADELQVRLDAVETNLLPEEGLLRLEVFTLDGALVGWLAEPGIDHEPWPEGLARARGGEFPVEFVHLGDARPEVRAAHLVRLGNEPRWLAVARVDRARSERAMAGMRRHLLLGAPAVAGLVFAAMYGVLALALRPLHELVNDARSLAAEGLGQRLAEPTAGSELGELARLLNVMLSRAEETMGRLRRFAADASHELRTPLTRMRGEAEVALRVDDPAVARAALESIVDELDSMRRLVEALLELARGDTAELRAAAPFDLAALVRELGEEARVVGETRELGVRVEVPDGPVVVQGSRDLIVRALWNVVDNALGYVPAGGGVSLSLGMDGERARVTVQDDGPGVPADLVPHLFQPFGRGAEGRVRGHGLGLALARTIARRAGGDLAHVPTPRGAAFALTLPMV